MKQRKRGKRYEEKEGKKRRGIKEKGRNKDTGQMKLMNNEIK